MRTNLYTIQTSAVLSYGRTNPLKPLSQRLHHIAEVIRPFLDAEDATSTEPERRKAAFNEFHEACMNGVTNYRMHLNLSKYAALDVTNVAAIDGDTLKVVLTETATYEEIKTMGMRGCFPVEEVDLPDAKVFFSFVLKGKDYDVFCNDSDPTYTAIRRSLLWHDEARQFTSPSAFLEPVSVREGIVDFVPVLSPTFAVMTLMKMDVVYEGSTIYPILKESQYLCDIGSPNCFQLRFTVQYDHDYMDATQPDTVSLIIERIE